MNQSAKDLVMWYQKADGLSNRTRSNVWLYMLVQYGG